MRISDWSSDVCSSDLPFIVAAGDGTITALGTVFDVDLERDDRVVVQLLNGAPDVRVPAAAVSGTAPILLAPGPQLVFWAAKALAPVQLNSNPFPDRPWPCGVHKYTGVPPAPPHPP